jgi:peptidoglycan/LPS O-acetylase OafA/YrhL
MKFCVESLFGIQGTFGAFTHNNLRAFLSNITMIQSLNIHNEATFNSPSWSISVEFYTYLFFGLSLNIFRRHEQLYIWFVGFVIACSLLFLVYAVGHLSVSIDFGYIRCLLGFYCGIIIYKIYTWLNRYGHIQNLSKLWWSILELLVVVALVATLIVKSSIDIVDFLVFLISFVLILIMLFSQGVVSQILTNKYIIYLGKISFSLYMCHFLFSSITKNLLKLVYGSNFILDSWGGYIQVPVIPANIAFLGYIILSLGSAIFLNMKVENRFRIRK